ncbi:MAG: hypothetical protein HYY04_05470, partial [Chloroflexi bacterium]|nr:hypothetical protein [Chloroflexota bacterium]
MHWRRAILPLLLILTLFGEVLTAQAGQDVDITDVIVPSGWSAAEMGQDGIWKVSAPCVFEGQCFDVQFTVVVNNAEVLPLTLEAIGGEGGWGITFDPAIITTMGSTLVTMRVCVPASAVGKRTDIHVKLVPPPGKTLGQAHGLRITFACVLAAPTPTNTPTPTPVPPTDTPTPVPPTATNTPTPVPPATTTPTPVPPAPTNTPTPVPAATTTPTPVPPAPTKTPTPVPAAPTNTPTP